MSEVFVILLRAIGPATHAIMSMDAWRAASRAAGFSEPQTYLATGNMVTRASGSADSVGALMTDLVRRLGLPEHVVAMARKRATLRALVDANPFGEAARQRPARLAAYFFAAPHPDFAWVEDHEGPERIAIVGNHLMVDYGPPDDGPVRLPRIIEARSGQATARNWSTVSGLLARADARAEAPA